MIALEVTQEDIDLAQFSKPFGENGYSSEYCPISQAATRQFNCHYGAGWSTIAPTKNKANALDYRVTKVDEGKMLAFVQAFDCQLLEQLHPVILHFNEF